MGLSPSSPAVAAELTKCDSEPIHLLGGIQPFGFMLSVNADWIVVRTSENTHSYISLNPVELAGQPVERCIAKDVLHDIRGRLQLAA